LWLTWVAARGACAIAARLLPVAERAVIAVGRPSALVAVVADLVAERRSWLGARRRARATRTPHTSRTGGTEQSVVGAVVVVAALPAGTAFRVATMDAVRAWSVSARAAGRVTGIHAAGIRIVAVRIDEAPDAPVAGFVAAVGGGTRLRCSRSTDSVDAPLDTVAERPVLTVFRRFADARIGDEVAARRRAGPRRDARYALTARVAGLKTAAGGAVVAFVIGDAARTGATGFVAFKRRLARAGARNADAIEA
jgi:hypothetical protein